MLGMKNNNLLMIDVPFFKIYRNPNVFAINIGIVCALLSFITTFGHKYAFQEFMNVITPAAAYVDF